MAANFSHPGTHGYALGAEALALPFGTDTAREPASRAEGKLKGISTFVDYGRFGNSSHSASP
jgi:hypothetical protein